MASKKNSQRADLRSRRLNGIKAVEQPQDPGRGEIRSRLRADSAAKREAQGSLIPTQPC